MLKSQNGALMQTPWVCVRERRCLSTPPWSHAAPWNPRPKACRLRTPALGFSHPKTHDNGRACPLNLPGGIPSPSTPDQPSAGWMGASAMPRWIGTQGALPPENPAPEISLSRPFDDLPSLELRQAGLLAGPLRQRVSAASQARAASRRCTTSRSTAPAPYRAPYPESAFPPCRESIFQPCLP